ncbi:hypothetical protein NM208_g5976 [Fusarium decemcellulare]|uniref:Uncharacterized protein n=1 Tax=Fusarium decemcellulare TaxID=57161 RepID=A0ACC1SEZ7_9HYPO|nr:hypothetical protein NM208_g5976 [Fusarium decemcellulare]
MLLDFFLLSLPLLCLVASAQDFGGGRNLTIAFFSDSQEDSCQSNDTSKGLVLTTDSIPTSYTCFNVSDIFSQSEKVGFQNGTMPVRGGDGQFVEPNGVHWLLEKADNFSSKTNYSRVWYEQTSPDGVGEDGSWVFYVYAFEDCEQIVDGDYVDSDRFPWYETSCLTERGGQCRTLPYSIKSFAINKAASYNKNHGGCEEWAYKGSKASTRSSSLTLAVGLASVSSLILLSSLGKQMTTSAWTLLNSLLEAIEAPLYARFRKPENP